MEIHRQQVDRSRSAQSKMNLPFRVAVMFCVQLLAIIVGSMGSRNILFLVSFTNEQPRRQCGIINTSIYFSRYRKYLVHFYNVVKKKIEGIFMLFLLFGVWSTPCGCGKVPTDCGSVLERALSIKNEQDFSVVSLTALALTEELFSSIGYLFWKQ